MKRSTVIVLIIVPSLTACDGSMDRPRDPCVSQNYNAAMCATAIQSNGYYFDDIWYPHYYAHPVIFYQQSYVGFVARGGTAVSIPPTRFIAPEGGTIRGGFGGSGAARASGGAGE